MSSHHLLAKLTLSTMHSPLELALQNLWPKDCHRAAGTEDRTSIPDMQPSSFCVSRLTRSRTLCRIQRQHSQSQRQLSCLQTSYSHSCHSSHSCYHSHTEAADALRCSCAVQKGQSSVKKQRQHSNERDSTSVRGAGVLINQQPNCRVQIACAHLCRQLRCDFAGFGWLC